MRRRTFLQGMAFSTAYGGLLPGLFQAASALEPADLAGSDPDLHLLRRISFGPDAASLARLREIGRDAYLEEQLDASDLATELQVRALYPLTNLSGTLVYLTTAAGAAIDNHIQELQYAALYRALFSTAQLRELMVDFWNDHFNTYVRKNPVPLKLDFDREVIRPNALGNFKTLFRATVRSAEMLHYLDNWQNRKDAVNENYARELLELQTLGQGHFSEADMRALSRILTGLTYINDLVAGATSQLSLDYGKVIFVAANHDDGAKTFLGASFPAGGGEDEIDRAIELILAQPATATHIATKLCRRFVADEPPAALVTAVAARFTATGGDIREMLRTIFASAEFAASTGAKLKRPQEMMIGALRACGLGHLDQTELLFALGLHSGNENGRLFESLQSAGHLPYAWVPPNGYPDRASYWGNTNACLYQQRFLVGTVEDLGFNYLLSHPVEALLSGNSVATGLTRARTPRDAVEHACANLMLEHLPDDARAAALAFVAQDSEPDAGMDAALLETRVKGLVFALLASPWFLRR